MIRLALYSALSDRASMERIAVLDSFEKWQTPRPKRRSMPCPPWASRARSSSYSGETTRRLSRLSQPHPRQDHRRGEINAYDVLDCDWILFTDATLPARKRPSNARRHEHPDPSVVSEKTYALMDNAPTSSSSTPRDQGRRA